jgi:hypothetical protein
MYVLEGERENEGQSTSEKNSVRFPSMFADCLWLHIFKQLYPVVTGLVSLAF